MPGRITIAVGFLAALGWLGAATLHISAGPIGTKKAHPQSLPQGVLKSQSNMVLVDVVVTDKHGNYSFNLKQKDFHVFEDGKEQTIASFSYEAGSRAAASVLRAGGRESAGAANENLHQRFIVLFFDDSVMNPQQQLYERQEAVKFVESAASPARLFAVIDFDGAVKLTQDFTSNTELLVNAIKWPKAPAFSWAVNPSSAALRVITRDRLRAIRAVGKFLSAFPGRQTMIYLSSFGIPAPGEYLADFHETVDALNRDNVGVYTIDSRSMLATSTTLGTKPGTGMPIIPIYADGFQEISTATGAFTVTGSNDLLAGLERASDEIDHAYILGYMQPNPVHDGAKHKITVKVNQPGSVVRARESYIDTMSPDYFVAQAEGKMLEDFANGPAPGNIPIEVTTPYFYIKPGLSRVHLTVSLRGSDIEFKKREDKFESRIDFLGFACRPDGSVAARFTDTVSLDFDSDEKQALTRTSYYYEGSFRIPPGDYTFKLVLSAGVEKIGKFVEPLVVDPYSGEHLALSGPAFGDSLYPFPLISEETDPEKLEGSVPMTALGSEVVPSSNNHLRKDKQAVVYMEIYDPLLSKGVLTLGFLYAIVDQKTHQKVHSSNTIQVNEFIRPGKPLVPVIFSLPIGKLSPGEYSIEIHARDSAGESSASRTGYFYVD